MGIRIMIPIASTATMTVTPPPHVREDYIQEESVLRLAHVPMNHSCIIILYVLNNSFQSLANPENVYVARSSQRCPECSAEENRLPRGSVHLGATGARQWHHTSLHGRVHTSGVPRLQLQKAEADTQSGHRPFGTQECEPDGPASLYQVQCVLICRDSQTGARTQQNALHRSNWFVLFDKENLHLLLIFGKGQLKEKKWRN
ncbi:hypothetical protein HPB48_022445 [Haemaphysalis longicornis]|uniref:Uncharacterized protein n=1 Tax=Haemaphysalis longicornis TaxID=44386 RepID=A0A9J6FX01_HAELO|nr:hypothetical protein HPB48_022445 [Haemaphysalis longicornis]